MRSINFIKHLIAFHQKEKPAAFGSKHYCLYLSMFHIWNQSKFKKQIAIFRSELMESAHIGSRSTYQKCLKDLHRWKYITYFPSNNPNQASKVKIREFRTAISTCTESSQALDQTLIENKTRTVPSVGPIKNNNKPYKTENKKSFIKKVQEFFKAKASSSVQARLFFNYYEAANWKRGTQPIKNWQAAANYWILQEQEKQKKKAGWNLHTTQEKDYSIPL